VDQTVDKIQELLRANGVKLFALVDHSGEAKKAGIEMPPTKLLIFGSPKAGTPLMIASPTIAIDLPLKLLVAQVPLEQSGSRSMTRHSCATGMAFRRNCCRTSW
jgi:uncharacterized protein (DUF302 family)